LRPDWNAFPTLEEEFEMVDRDRFTLAFRTLNQADFEHIFSEMQAEVELQSSSKSVEMGVPEQ